MARFENTMGISRITYTDSVKCMCPLGQAPYTNNLVVQFTPTDIIPDYCELEAEIGSLHMQDLTIEQVVEEVFNLFKNEYHAINIVVSSEVTDAVHPPVVVTKHE